MVVLRDEARSDEEELLHRLASSGGTASYESLSRHGWPPRERVDASIAYAIQLGHITPPARRATEYTLTEHGWSWRRMLCSR